MLGVFNQNPNCVLIAFGNTDVYQSASVDTVDTVTKSGPRSMSHLGGDSGEKK